MKTAMEILFEHCEHLGITEKMFIESKVENAKQEYAHLHRVEAAARAYIQACSQAAETKEWDDMAATDKEYHELETTLKEMKPK